MLNKTHPQDPKSFTKVPTTEKVDFKVVIQDDDDMFFPKGVHSGLVREQGALCA